MCALWPVLVRGPLPAVEAFGGPSKSSTLLYLSSQSTDFHCPQIEGVALCVLFNFFLKLRKSFKVWVSNLSRIYLKKSFHLRRLGKACMK